MAGSGRSSVVWLLGAALACGSCARNTVPPAPPLPSPSPTLVPPDPPRLPPPPLTVPTTRTPAPRNLGLVGNPWKPAAKSREWKYIVLHHTASGHATVASIDTEHKAKKDKSGKNWLGIGYHFLIGNGHGMDDGEIEATFRWKDQLQGAHAGSANKDYNEVGIGVCLVGNFEEDPPSDAQMRAVKKLVRALKTEYEITSERVVGHTDVREGGTACPGKLFPMAEVAAVFPENAGLVFRRPLNRMFEHPRSFSR